MKEKLFNVKIIVLNSTT